MIKSIRESITGIFGVLIKPNLPRLAVVVALVIGVLVGLFWGYNVHETIFYNGDPRTLEQSWQNEWVKLLADRYAVTTDRDISANIIDLLQRVDDPVGIVDSLLASPAEAENAGKLQALRPLAEAAQPNAAIAPQPEDTWMSLRPFVMAPLVLAIAAVIFVVIYNLLIKPIVVDSLRRSLRGEKTSQEVKEVRKAQQEERRQLETRKTDFAAVSNLGPPLMQRMTTYPSMGGGDFDESYEIEEAEMFLGQCGAVVSDAIETPANAAMAIEVWLFDKDDFVRTLTKVFVSDYVYNNPSLRARAQEKGDVVLAQPGAVIILETNTLRVQARIVEMAYAVSAAPPNSTFQRFVLELAAWRKQPGGVPTVPLNAPTPVQSSSPAGAPTFAPPPPPPTFTPAPTTPQTPIPPQPSTLPPMAPPSSVPPQRTIPPDDDPFGGTGDFAPIG
ncbi:MAG: hypothetical protein IPK19_30730 [Chloroflexi bacterium]|nr:hypothetical protein [Chloroflexota bacterium]